MSEVMINREHKDRLFRLLFGHEKNKINLLSLYNAINHTNYVNPEELEITTMDDCIYMKMKNDVSVLLYQVLALYEQQSSWNPNMPLRGFFYFSHLYEKYIAVHELNIYGKKLIKIPTPQYIVFYNGTDMEFDEETLRLSDAFDNPVDIGGFEWTATVKNINLGHNSELLESCKVLKQYAQFVDKIRCYRRELGDIKKAADITIQECIKEGILAEFLIAHRAEVYDVILTEYDEEFVMNALREECREEGLEEGRVEGRAEGRAEEREVGLRNLIETIQELKVSKEDAVQKVQIRYQLNRTDAEEQVEQYWK